MTETPDTFDDFVLDEHGAHDDPDDREAVQAFAAEVAEYCNELGLRPLHGRAS